MNFPSSEDFKSLNEDGDLIDLKVLHGDSKLESDNLRSWEIITVSKDQIEIKLDFFAPLQVSQGEEPDILMLQLQLSDFPDEKNGVLPPQVFK